MKKVLFLILLTQTIALADDRDEAIFGGETSPPAASTTPTLNEAPASTVSSITEKFRVGGRLELSEIFLLNEHQSLDDAALQFKTRADVYFDAEPNDIARVFLRLRYQTPLNTETTDSNTQLLLDEAWVRWHAQNKVFFTLGRQHLKWGSARFWNPTDFLAAEVRNPFEDFDARLGEDLFKIHLPFEGQGHNLYAVAKMPSQNGAQVKDAAAALRGEFVVATSELALTTAFRSKGRISLGADLSAGVGPFDLYSENGWTRSPDRIRFSGEFSPSTQTLPTQTTDQKNFIGQHVVGINTSVKYSDTDNVTFAVEYFENGLGYTNADLEFYSFLAGENRPLYLGRRYGAAYIRLPQPGNWEDTNFALMGVRNLVDGSTQATLNVTNEIFPRVSLVLTASRCFGGPGDLCFALPQSFQDLATNPFVPEEAQKAIRALPTTKPIVNARVGLIANF